VVEGPDLDPHVREFAEEQVFNITDETILYRPDQPARSLEQVQKALHDSDINSGSQTFAWCGMRVWLGDPLNGFKASASVNPGGDNWASESAAANWLHETARRLYPESKYARDHSCDEGMS
jgi:hypothetical protein